jgi:hypothetical protein
MSTQPSSRVAFQQWWGRTFRVALRVVFVIWIVIGVLGALMSIIDPLGMILFGLVAIAGAFGLRATRRPFHEWGIAALVSRPQSEKSSAETLRSPDGTLTEVNDPPRPNKSLERTREG